MTLQQVTAEAEKDAEQLIESVRQRVVVLVMSSHGFNGPTGQSLRSQVAGVASGIKNAGHQFQTDLNDAWTAGIERAEKGMPATQSSLVRDTGPFLEAMHRSFANLATGLEERVTNVLLRASLNEDWTRDKVVDLIGNTDKAGQFKEFTERVDGIVDWATQATESTAYARRIREIQKHAALAPATKLAKGDVKKGLVTLIIKFWDHSGGGNPPRANHIAFSGKGVPVDMKFHLPGRDGKTYLCDGPHDINLPPSEAINCHCTEISEPFQVTPEAEKAIRERAAETGALTKQDIQSIIAGAKPKKLTAAEQKKLAAQQPAIAIPATAQMPATSDYAAHFGGVPAEQPRILSESKYQSIPSGTKTFKIYSKTDRGASFDENGYHYESRGTSNDGKKYIYEPTGITNEGAQSLSASVERNAQKYEEWGLPDAANAARKNKDDAFNMYEEDVIEKGYELADKMLTSVGYEQYHASKGAMGSKYYEKDGHRIRVSNHIVPDSPLRAEGSQGGADAQVILSNDRTIRSKADVIADIEAAME